MKVSMIATSAALILSSASAYPQDPHNDVLREPYEPPGEYQTSGSDYDDASQAVDELQKAAARRDELQSMAEEALTQLSGEAGVDVESAAGYAVFDTTKAGLIATGAGGSGVAVDNETGEKTYMHVGAAGIGLGAGIESYKLILVFDTDEALAEFVDGHWSSGASAQAAAGDDGASQETHSQDDISIYRIDDTGLIAQADVTGMKFWASEKLNLDS
ncbi:MAG TPA: YSC84-related protein [Gammaproteobacteria bacterium]